MIYHFLSGYRNIHGRSMNRHLPCHPEPIRCTQGKLREGSVARDSEMLRCSIRCAQDKAGTHPNAWITVFLCIIGAYSCPDYFGQLA
jgi:hypothetical protein